MIANDEQLGIVQAQVTRLETAVRSLAVTVRPQSEQQFQLLAEGYVDQLRQLRRDIDAYLGIVGPSEEAVAIVEAQG
jgi:hypothetical protein